MAGCQTGAWLCTAWIVLKKSLSLLFLFNSMSAGLYLHTKTQHLALRAFLAAFPQPCLEESGPENTRGSLSSWFGLSCRWEAGERSDKEEGHTWTNCTAALFFSCRFHGAVQVKEACANVGCVSTAACWASHPRRHPVTLASTLPQIPVFVYCPALHFQSSICHSKAYRVTNCWLLLPNYSFKREVVI